MKTRKFHHSMKYPLSCIGNVDETPLLLDMPGETTLPESVSDLFATQATMRGGTQWFLLQWLMGES